MLQNLPLPSKERHHIYYNRNKSDPYNDDNFHYLKEYRISGSSYQINNSRT